MLPGTKMTPEQCARIGAGRRGVVTSAKGRAAMSRARIGNTNAKGKHWSPEARALASASRMGHKPTFTRPHTEDEAYRCGSAFRGKHLTEEHKAKLAAHWPEALRRELKRKNPRNTFRDHRWAMLVKKRDGYCLWCGATESLHADHIRPYASHPDLRFDLNNGQTLCAECHREKTAGLTGPSWLTEALLEGVA